MDTDKVNLLPYLLLPLMGNEEYADEDTDGMLDEVQLLPPDKARDSQNDIMRIHLDTLLLLTTTREARDEMRKIKVYPIIRECHLQVEDDEVREGCDRIVQMLMLQDPHQFPAYWVIDRGRDSAGTSSIERQIRPDAAFRVTILRLGGASFR